MKKKILSVTIPLIVAGLSIGVFILAFSQKSITEDYNTNPDLGSKTVGSISAGSALAEYVPIETFDFLISGSDLIIIGTALDDGAGATFSMYGGVEIAEAVEGKGYDSYANCTLTKIRVEKVIGGTHPNTDTITLFQL